MEHGENYRRWTEKADAMNEVANLAHDDSYVDFLSQNFIRRRHNWESSESEPIVMNRNYQFGDLSRFTSPNQRMVVSDPVFQATELPMGTGIAGKMSVNSQEFTISGLEDEISLKNDKFPDLAINIDLKDLNEFLLGLAAAYVDDGKGSPRMMMEEYDLAKTDIERFISIVRNMGNLDGQSSTTTWSIVRDDSVAFVARLSEIEDVTSSVLNHTIQTIESTELLAIENGLDITQTNNPDRTADTEEVSYSGLAAVNNLERFIAEALRRSDVEGRPGFDYRHSSGYGYEQSRKYANDCQNFLKLLDRLLKPKQL